MRRARKLTILKPTINFCWFFFKWGTIAAVIGVLAAAPYLYRRLDEAVRSRVEAIFAAHYKGLRVSVHSAALTDGGIQVRGVSIVDPQADGPRAELAYFDELFLVCKTDLSSLLNSMPSIVEVVARRPTIRATHRRDGTWSTGRLFPLPKLGDQPPAITIEGGTLEMFDPLQKTPKTFTVRDGNFKVMRQANGEPAGNDRRLLAITGYCAADSIHRVEVAGAFDPAGGAWELSGIIDGLDVTPELIHDLPYECPNGLNLLETLRGQVQGKFAVRYNAAAAQPWTYSIAGQLNRGRLDDSRLPQPLTELRAGFKADNAGFAIENLTANAGPASIMLGMRRDGYGEHAPMALVAKATQLRLDRQLSTVLPDSWQDVWCESLPAGEIDLDATLHFDGRTWTPDISVTCHDVAVTYPKFPYRLEHGSGQITLRNNILKVENLIAYSDGEPIRLRGEIHEPGADWTGSFTVESRNLRVDQKLSRALPPKPREIVESLHARGSIGLFVHYWRQAGGAGAQSHLDPSQRLRPAVREIPLSDAQRPRRRRGQRPVLDVPGLARHERQRPGNVQRRHEAQRRWRQHSRHALQRRSRALGGRAARRLAPVGAATVERAESDRSGRPARRCRASDQLRDPQIRVTATPVKDTVTIEPGYFPYRLENVRGEFDYENGRVVLSHLSAEHGPNTRLTAHGACEVDAAGGWRLRLENLDCGRLTTDRDLVQALPPRLRKAITEMHLSGPVSIRGRFDLSSTGRPGEPLAAGWDVACDLQQVRMAYSLPLDNINGRLWLKGSFDGRQFRSHGGLDLDSLTYKDFQFTEVRGPLWIDDAKFLLGVTAPPAPNDHARSVTARCCGGMVRTDGWVSFGPDSHYNFDAVVAQAQLGLAAQEVFAGRQKLSGEVYGHLNLHGQGSGTNLLSGNGHVELRNADVYELPVMLSLLKVLSLRAPDTRAFSSSNINFRLEGGHIYFDRIHFSGDAISLRGTGEMDLDKNVQLTFYTVVGRDQFTVPLLSDVLGGASQQLMAIDVTGPLDHPQVVKKALPAVTEALQEIQAELQNMGTATAATPPAQPTPIAQPATPAVL